MKKNGFTLIELLAVIVILGVILVIAIPSISAAILNSRKNSFVATANEFVDGLRMMTLTNPEILTTDGSSTCKSLSQIKLEKGSSTRSPFGKDYTNDSQVCVAYNSTTSEYDYSVCLVDTGGNSICDIATESGGETTYTPVDIKTVTKDLVAVGGSIPEPEPEPEPVIEPMVILSKGADSVNLYTNITGGWVYKSSYDSTSGNIPTTFTYNGNKYPSSGASWANNQLKMYPNNKINVTNYNTITASGYVWTDYSPGFDSQMILGLKSATPTFVNTDFDYQTTAQTGVIATTKVSFNLTLDISAVSGEYYIILGVTHPSSPSANTVNMIVDNITLSP